MNEDVNEEMSEAQLLTLITNIVDKHGCKIIEIDLENRVIDLDGPEDAKVSCAIELADLLE